MSALGSFYPAGVSEYVPNMTYAADVDINGHLPFDLSPAVALKAAAAKGIIDAASIATAGTSTAFAAAFAKQNTDESLMGRFGRNLTVVASAAATSAVSVKGEDYLGQAVVENFTLAGTTPVVGKKAFKRVTSVTFGATAAVTIDIGYGNVLGLPYAYIGEGVSYTDDVLNTSQGTFVAYVATQTVTSGDPRGTWTPAAANIPDGIRKHKVVYQTLKGNLYGPKHVIV